MLSFGIETISEIHRMTTINDNPLAILEAARNLLSDPAHWTRDVAARDAAGFEVDVTNESATCFCSLGAIWRSAKYAGPRLATPDAVLDAKMYLERAIDGGRLFDGDVARFNDRAETTHADVMKLFDLAIELAKQEEFE